MTALLDLLLSLQMSSHLTGTLLTVLSQLQLTAYAQASQQNLQQD